MPQGDKSSYTTKQKRKAEHIEEGYEKRGVRSKEAARRAWATVNKQDGGARKKRSKSAKSTAAPGRKSSTPRRSSTRRGSTARSRPAARSRAASRSRRQ